MRYLLFLLILVHFSFLNAQTSMVLDARTLHIDNLNAKLKSGEFINFKIANITAIDSFVIEFTSRDVFNDDVFKKFVGIGMNAAVAFVPSDTLFLLPFQVADKDYTVLKITKYKNGKKDYQEVYNLENQGGIKFDISYGIFGTNLKDSAYVLKFVSDSTRQIIPEEIGNIRVGIGVLAHLHSRSKGWLNWGGCVGFEVDNDTKVSYLSGLSLIVGRDKKLFLNAGIAASRVDELSNIYNQFDLLTSAISEVPTAKVWRVGWFAAVTHNF